MKICIVDDEKNCIDNLKGIFSAYSDNKNVPVEIESYSNGEDFKTAYEKGRFDIVFLDIYIGETTGMDLAKHIRGLSDHDMIIFCTTSLEDMPQAFRYHAFEYIIKPAEYERVEKVLDDAIIHLPELKRYIELIVNRENIKVDVSDITSVTSRGHYLDVALSNKDTLTVRLTLNDFADKVGSQERFLSINKGIVVNMNHIKAIQDKDCIMNNGSIFPVKVRDSAKIKKLWQEYCFEQIRKDQLKG